MTTGSKSGTIGFTSHLKVLLLRTNSWMMVSAAIWSTITLCRFSFLNKVSAWQSKVAFTDFYLQRRHQSDNKRRSCPTKEQWAQSNFETLIKILRECWMGKASIWSHGSSGYDFGTVNPKYPSLNLGESICLFIVRGFQHFGISIFWSNDKGAFNITQSALELKVRKKEPGQPY